LVNDNEVMWRIVEAGWLYLVVDPDRAGQTMVLLAVRGLDSATAALESRGVKIARSETIVGAGRKAWFGDPDGNEVALIEVLPSDT
jgi:predicted enzyme related to lactoylglutathione lyase